MKCYSCSAEIVPHPNYPQVKVWLEPNTEPPRPHKCPPKDKVIQNGKWRGYTFKEAFEIMDHVEKTHAKYLASLREMFRSPYA
jgi:hypothetical protein